MSTGTMVGTGSYDDTAKTWTYASNFNCPLTNSKRETKSITRLIDNNHYVFEMYDRAPNGKEFKNLEIAYKRVK